MDILARIKRLVVAHRVIFTEKAQDELIEDNLTRELVFESILNAPAIYKVLRSRSEGAERSERLYVIKGLTFESLAIYTKGKIIIENGEGYFYVFISSKLDTDV